MLIAGLRERVPVHLTAAMGASVSRLQLMETCDQSFHYAVQHGTSHNVICEWEGNFTTQVNLELSSCFIYMWRLALY